MRTFRSEYFEVEVDVAAAHAGEARVGVARAPASSVCRERSSWIQRSFRSLASDAKFGPTFGVTLGGGTLLRVAERGSALPSDLSLQGRDTFASRGEGFSALFEFVPPGSLTRNGTPRVCLGRDTLASRGQRVSAPFGFVPTGWGHFCESRRRVSAPFGFVPTGWGHFCESRRGSLRSVRICPYRVGTLLPGAERGPKSKKKDSALLASWQFEIPCLSDRETRQHE
jgi:hypothetical protein